MWCLPETRRLRGRDLAMEAIDIFTSGVSKDVLLKEPRLDSLRKMLLGSALGYYQRLQARLVADPHGETEELAAALERIGDLTRETGSMPDALKAYERALAIHERLASEVPGDPRRAATATQLKANVGDCLYQLGKVAEGVRTIEEALSSGQRLIRAHPDDPVLENLVANILQDLGAKLFIRAGRGDEARGHWRSSTEMFERLSRPIPGTR